MISVDLTYIIVFVVATLLGFILGKIWGRHRGHMEVLHIGLEVKNPEMWELLHFLVVDKNEKARAKQTEALERKHRSGPRGGDSSGDVGTETPTTTHHRRRLRQIP